MRITEIINSDLFKKFERELEEKMLAGLEEHGESKHEIISLVEELKDEALDIAGWGFLLWRKIDKLQKKVIKSEAEISNLTPPL